METLERKWEEKEHKQEEETEKNLEELTKSYEANRNQIIEGYNNANLQIRPSNETLKMKKVEEGLAKLGKYLHK